MKAHVSSRCLIFSQRSICRPLGPSAPSRWLNTPPRPRLLPLCSAHCPTQSSLKWSSDFSIPPLGVNEYPCHLKSPTMLPLKVLVQIPHHSLPVPPNSLARHPAGPPPPPRASHFLNPQDGGTTLQGSCREPGTSVPSLHPS